MRTKYYTCMFLNIHSVLCGQVCFSDAVKLTSVGKSHFPDVYFGHCRNGILTDSVMKNTLLL